MATEPTLELEVIGRVLGIATMTALISGCFPGNEFEEPAPREMIVAAAARCGLPNFEPSRRNGAFAADVDNTVPNDDEIEACIIEDVEQRQGYRLER